MTTGALTVAPSSRDLGGGATSRTASVLRLVALVVVSSLAAALVVAGAFWLLAHQLSAAGH